MRTDPAVASEQCYCVGSVILDKLIGQMGKSQTKDQRVELQNGREF